MIADASHAAWCSPVRRFRSARPQPLRWSRRRRGAAEDQPGGRQISDYAEGRPTLRRLRQFPTEWDYQFTTSMAQQYLAIKPKHDGGATGPNVTRYRNVTAARARLTLSGGQKVTGPGAAPGAAILVP